jgi:hypothetical protein
MRPPVQFRYILWAIFLREGVDLIVDTAQEPSFSMVAPRKVRKRNGRLLRPGLKEMLSTRKLG